MSLSRTFLHSVSNYIYQSLFLPCHGRLGRRRARPSRFFPDHRRFPCVPIAYEHCKPLRPLHTTMEATQISYPAVSSVVRGVCSNPTSFHIMPNIVLCSLRVSTHYGRNHPVLFEPAFENAAQMVTELFHAEKPPPSADPVAPVDSESTARINIPKYSLIYRRYAFPSIVPARSRSTTSATLLCNCRRPPGLSPNADCRDLHCPTEWTLTLRPNVAVRAFPAVPSCQQ